MTKRLLAIWWIGALLAAGGCREGDDAGSTTPGAGGSPTGTATTTGAGGAPVSPPTTGAAGGGAVGGSAGALPPPVDVGATCAGASTGSDNGNVTLPSNNSGSSLDLGVTVSQAVPPPAISGGTLLVLSDGKTVVAADPDRDQVYLVDWLGSALRATVALNPGDEPGRVVEDAAGLAHVALRGGGAVVTVDPLAGIVTARTSVCPAPRGLAYDPATDLLHVACAGGELVSLSASSGAVTRTLHLDADLRDVIVEGDHLRVSRFRSAELLSVDSTGNVTGRLTPPSFRSAVVRGGELFNPAVAWRTMAVPGGGIAMLHQRGCDDIVPTGRGKVSGGYGSSQRSCDSIVHTAVSLVLPDGTVKTGPAIDNMPVAVDMAVSPDGSQIAFVSAGNASAVAALLTSGYMAPTADLTDATEQCVSPFPHGPCGKGFCSATGQATAIAFAPDGSVIVQSREPAVLNLGDGSFIQLSDVSRADTGHTVFHSNAGSGLACASCHAEGMDDGRVWNFACEGARRTQSLQVGLRGTEPFHWDGDERSFPLLAHDVFTLRMSGPDLASDQIDATLSWLDAQPRILRAAPVDTAAVAHGRALFTTALCATCHAGPHMTNNQTMDVGTGGKFQVPSLVGIANHPPFLHNGCAATLRDRFTPACGGGDLHGLTSKLSAGDVSDLVSYLETL